MAARFIIPPLISEGYRCPASDRFTRSKQNSARFLRSFVESLENISKGNITFSITVMLSNKAEPWNNIPISRRSIFNSCLFIVIKSLPSYNICPVSGFINPMIFLIITVLPEPLRPMIRFVLPSSNVVLISFKTTRPSKDFVIFLTSIIFK